MLGILIGSSAPNVSWHSDDRRSLAKQRLKSNDFYQLIVLEPGFRSSGRRDKEQTFRSERSLSLRLIRLRRKWVFASRKFTGSSCSKSSNGSKRFERLERFELTLSPPGLHRSKDRRFNCGIRLKRD
jgi:hypothetical protein